MLFFAMKHKMPNSFQTVMHWFSSFSKRVAIALMADSHSYEYVDLLVNINQQGIILQ